MAKGKNLNPADAFRKAQRKKELKKNKTERSKARDFALVKKDTKDLEEEIEKLEANGESSNADKTRLTELKSELEKIMKKKEEYVAEHPEHRRLVYKARKQEGGEDKPEEQPLPQKRNLFNKHGLPRHPERSIYYDPVMNPYGVPPPGMPYAERPLRPDEINSDVEFEDDDDDIAMPEGPPPGMTELPVDSDEDIPMPDGPPPAPGQEIEQSIPENPPLPPGPPPLPVGLPPPPPSFPPNFMPNFPPPPPGVPPVQQFIPMMNFPPPPPGFPSMGGLPPPPPPPPGFVQMTGFPTQPAFPPPPPGFFPKRSQSSSAMQDPLSSVPHQTFQAHRAGQHTPSMPPPPPAHPSLPPKPPAIAANPRIMAAATVEVAPQLRDFKKEATAFVPAAVKRKKATVASGSGSSARINAAPLLGAPEGDDAPDDSGPVAARPDLLSALKGHFGPAPTPIPPADRAAPGKPQPAKQDDYAKFMEEMGDLISTK
ncbi:hypothetical protein EYR36_007808 [Pleurotus pulmonarius]|nr:hypothetical protein EYR36_007808 [Pleurotus pulmonarius]